jgi:hypothetical protein
MKGIRWFFIERNAHLKINSGIILSMGIIKLTINRRKKMGANSIVNKNRLNRLSADPKSLRNTVEEIENGEKAFEKRKQEIINASQQSLLNDLKRSIGLIFLKLLTL